MTNVIFAGRCHSQGHLVCSRSAELQPSVLRVLHSSAIQAHPWCRHVCIVTKTIGHSSVCLHLVELSNISKDGSLLLEVLGIGKYPQILEEVK